MRCPAVPLIVSGDIHATALGRMMRVGTTDLSKNPVIPVVPGTLGSALNFVSSRGGPIQHPHHVDMIDAWTPVEENGFMLADFYKEKIELTFYAWSHKGQQVTDIPSIDARHRATLRPAA